MKGDQIFPIIDISYLISSYHPWVDKFNEKFYKDEKIIKIADQIANAFIEWGFLYLINHGIDDSKVSEAFLSAEHFFGLNKETKESFVRGAECTDGGYTGPNDERFDKALPCDIKEALDFNPTSNHRDKLNSMLPGFMDLHTDMYVQCQHLSSHLLRLIKMKLPVDDQDFLLNQHKFVGDMKGNPTISRMLLYPPITSEILSKQLRCGEHSDYGTFTLLFQDQAGGLQVMNPSGDFVDATPIPGSIVVNCADLLEIWSSGKFKSTRHRVLIPSNLEQSRQSYVFFLHADSKATVKCLDGSAKYKEVNSLQYLLKRFADTYN